MATRPATQEQTQAIVEALELLTEPGQVIELRIPNAQRRGNRTDAGYFNDLQALAKVATDQGRGQSAGVYFTLNPMNPALLARAENRLEAWAKNTTQDTDILYRRWLPIDADPVRPSGISSTEEEHTAALERAAKVRDWLTAKGWASPLPADSGNGAHLLYRLPDLPNTDENKTLLQRCLEALGALFDDDRVWIDTTVHNASRIWKVYGTLAAKGDHTEDRPHRWARILEKPETIAPVTLEQLQALAAMLPEPAQTPTQYRNGYRGTATPLDLEEWIRAHNLNVGAPRTWTSSQGQSKRWVFNVCPWNPAHTDKSAYLLQFPSGAISAGCHHNGCSGQDWHSLREMFDGPKEQRRREAPQPHSNGTGPGASHSEETPAEGNERSTWPYGVRNGQLVERQMVKIDDEWEEKQYPIADFTACIGGVIANEEGEETYTVTGDALRGGPFRCEIPALDFGDTRKLAAALGAAAGPFDPILAGKAQHLAPAIKKLTSDQLTRTRRYHRTGWAGDHFLLPGREPDNTEIALHRKLPYAIARSGDLAKGLQGLEALIHSMGPEVATIFLSALFQAPMAKPANWRGERYALFITGRSGTLKTSNSQAAMGLYGPGFMSDDALTKWGEGATENALMQMATQAHDLPFLVDNYKPNTGKGAQGWVAITHNILEGGEKDRLNRAAQLRDTKPIFCWPIFTGEDVPNVDAASLARVLIVPFSEENRTPKRTAQLAIAQEAARLGHLSTVGAAWLEWLESKEGQQVAKDAGARLLEYRSQWAAHLTQRRPDMVNPLRVATNLASNQLTWAAVCQHPTIGPMAIEHLESHRSGLLAISDEMANYTAEVLEAARFLAGLRELLATGRGLLVMNENHEAQLINQNAQDRIIGWTDNNAGAYLLPEIARLMVERVIGDLHISNTTLYDQIDTLGFLGRRDKGRKNYTKRIGNKTQKVLHIIGAALTDDVDPPTVEE